MNLFVNEIQSLTSDLHKALLMLSEEDCIDALNEIKKTLHEASPMKSEPVDCVLWLRAENVHGNDYNPNKVAPPEMRLLQLSIESDGYTQPIVAAPDGESCEVVDGFHRYRVGTERPSIRQRLKGRLPVVLIREERMSKEDRMASTVRHNRARGVHGVIPMMDVVANMLAAGMSDADVGKALGMDADEVLRFKQIKGLPSLFENREYSRAWEGE